MCFPSGFMNTKGSLPGTYKIGAWYHTHSFANLETGVGTVRGNYGLWTSADQMIWKETGSDEEPQGLGLFAQYGWSPSDRNVVDNYFGVGATYRGLIPQRDLDLTGVGLANAWQSTPGTTSERDLEIFQFIDVLGVLRNPPIISSTTFPPRMRRAVAKPASRDGSDPETAHLQ